MVLFNEFQKEFPGSFILIEKNQPSSNKHALHISCDEIYPHNLQAPLIGTLTPSLTSNASPDLIVSRTTFLAFFILIENFSRYNFHTKMMLSILLTLMCLYFLENIALGS